ncbi:MAG TPA: methylated-DNA--[protein]-cysteine S-methyltransferase [Acidimicrobiales bacterium]|nr:methylated-DNA--[protein]-cysteine S-methyltransferase [Acidimicrobiales bacterium]|tara:strand:+ start:706 stop:1203 length:498 start_codon:yes stop_codon:yes gene_type:complete
MNKVAKFSSHFGNLFIAFSELGMSGSALTQMTSLTDFCERVNKSTGSLCEETTSLPKTLVNSLSLWSEENNHSDLIFDFGNSTFFQQDVWKACQKIPFGATLSYSELASSIKRPKATRAVGSALGANPFLVLIPCHRVVRSNGDLGGYAYGTDLKMNLLKIESAK